VVWWAMRKPSRVTASAVPPAANLPAATPPETSPSALAPPAATSPAPTPVPAAAPAAAAPAAAPPPRTASATPSAAHAPTPAASAPAVAAATGGSTVRLVLNFSEGSWIDIYDADGTRLFHGMARSGSQHHVTGSAPLRVFLGNPPGVTLEANGHPVVMAGNPKPRRFSLDEAGHIVEVSAADSAAKGPPAQPRPD